MLMSSNVMLNLLLRGLLVNFTGHVGEGREFISNVTSTTPLIENTLLTTPRDVNSSFGRLICLKKLKNIGVRDIDITLEKAGKTAPVEETGNPALIEMLNEISVLS